MLAVCSHAVSNLRLWHGLLNKCAFSRIQRCGPSHHLKLMSSRCRLRHVLTDFSLFSCLLIVFYLFIYFSWVERIVCEVFLAHSISNSRLSSQVFMLIQNTQITCVHHWTCLFFDLMFLAFYLSTVIRLLFEWTPSLLCCIWQFPISLHFWFMDTTAIKFGTEWFSIAVSKNENPEIKKTLTGKGYPLCCFYFFSFSIIKAFAELSFPVTLYYVPVSFSTENTFSFIQPWSYCCYKWIFSINIILCSQVWITSKQSLWKELL